MSLRLNKNIVKYSAAAILLSIFTFIIIYKVQHSSPNQLKKAKQLVNNWQLADAENILEVEIKKEKPSADLIRLYFKTLVLRGKFLKADSLFSRHFINKKYFNTEIYLDYAEVNYYLGKIEKADSICSVIISNFSNDYASKDVSRAYKIIGLTKFFLGDYKLALMLQKEALAFAKMDNAQKEEADALRQLGVLAWYKGELDSALNNYYQPALQLYKNINDKIGEATTLSDIGLLYFDWKDWKKEFYYQLKALVIRQRIGDLMGIADSYNFFEHFPKLSKEIELLKYNLVEKSYRLSKELGYKWGMEVASNSFQQFFNRNIDQFGKFSSNTESITFTSKESRLVKEITNASKIDKIRNPAEAILSYKKILHLSESMGYAVMQFNSLLNLTNIYIENNKLKDALVTFDKAKTLSYSSLVPKFNSASLGILKSKMDIKNKDYNAALRDLNAITFYYDSLYYYNIASANNSLEWQNSLNSIYHYRNWAYSLLLDLLYKLNDQEAFFKYVERERSLIKADINQNGFSDENDDFANTFKKLTTIESNEDADLIINKLLTLLQNLINKEEKEIKSVSNIKNINKTGIDITLSSFRKHLDDDEIFIEYSAGEKYFYAQKISRENTSLIKIPLSQHELIERIIFFRKSIERGKWNAKDIAWRPPAHSLYTLLLDSLLNNEPGNAKKKIVLSPCSILHQIPFAALLKKSSKENNATSLVDSFPISYSYSARDYAEYLQKPKYHFESLLAFAPNGGELKYTEDEVSNIPKTLFGKIEILKGEKATLQKFQNKANSFNVIHISTHSEVDIINPLQSKIKFNDAYLKLIDLQNIPLNAELVVLSSCESGKTIGSLDDIPTSIDIQSFPKAILSSGTKCVLSTLWKVDDYSASEITTQFYYSLLRQKGNNNFDLPEALSAAQRNFYKTQTKKYHPFYWAPFILSE